jgi:Gas vesicle synthesis protein GvpL/GvpF
VRCRSRRRTENGGNTLTGIIKSDSPKTFGGIGIGGRGDQVYTVHYKEFAAVVSNCPLIVFDPTRAPARAF